MKNLFNHTAKIQKRKCGEEGELCQNRNKSEQEVRSPRRKKRKSKRGKEQRVRETKRGP